MSIVDWPVDHRDFQPQSFELWTIDNVQVSRSPTTGYPRSRALSGGRWGCSFRLAGGSWRTRARQAALLESLESGANRLRMWHLARPRPYGTIAGAPVVQAAAAKGAKQIALLTGTVGETVLPGDMLGLGVGGPLVRVRDAAASDGSKLLALSITRGINADVAINAPVFTVRPSTLWVPTNTLQVDRYLAGYAPSIDLQFEEVWE